MDFSQEFENYKHEPWALEYVSYENIKSDMDKRQKDHKWSDKDEKDFEISIRLEAEKVDFFIVKKQKEIDSRIAYCERRLSQNSRRVPNPSIYDATSTTLTEILKDLNELSKFTRYNVLALQKLIEYHDANTSYYAQPLFVDIIRTLSLDNQRFDNSLVKLSVSLDVCELNGQNPFGDQNLSKPEYTTTAKYWIHPNNITEVRSTILFNLPVHVSNPKNAQQPENNPISSIYVDNTNFNLYQSRLQRDEGSEAIYFRWNGSTQSDDIFVERKTHHAAWANNNSIKDGICLDIDIISDLISGKYTADQYASDLRSNGISEDTVKKQYFIASGIQKSIRDKKLEPIMRLYYQRTVFQVPQDDSISISLDTNVTFLREDGNGRRQGYWRRPDRKIDFPFNGIEPSEIYKFPYAVLETRLKQTQFGLEPPEWLSNLLQSGLVYEVPRFSKHLHGISYFWSARLPLLPWWSGQMDLDIRDGKKPHGNFPALTKISSLRPMVNGKLRIGYLEYQLERSSTLNRKNKPTVNRTITISKNSGNGHASYIAGSSLARASSMVKLRSTMIDQNKKPTPSSTLKESHNNPFNDPVWSKTNNPSDELKVTRVNLFDTSTTSLPQQSFSESGFGSSGYASNSSTENLIRKQAVESLNPSSTRDKNNSSNEEAQLNSYYLNDMKGMEEGQGRRKKLSKAEEEGATIEPKVFWASERTFITWLQFGATLLAAALTLLNFGDKINRIVGITFFCIAFAFAIYSMAFLKWRAAQIKNNPHLRYDDEFGPVFLAVLFVGAMAVNFALRWPSPAENTNYLGINGTTTSTDDLPL